MPKGQVWEGCLENKMGVDKESEVWRCPHGKLGVTLSAKKKYIPDWSLALPVSVVSLPSPPPPPPQCPSSPTGGTCPLGSRSLHSPATRKSVGAPGTLGIIPGGPTALSYLSLLAQVPRWAPTQPSPPTNGSGNSRCGSGSERQGERQPGPALRPGELRSTRSRPSATQTP